MTIRTIRPLLACAVGLSLTLAACSKSSSSGKDPVAATTPAATGRTPQATPDAAVRAMLEAEQRGDHEASFHLLSSMALKAFPDAESWEKHRVQFPEITAFTINSSQKGTVVTTVSHNPGLDAFVGLRAAKDTQRWHVTAEGGGWLVDGDPDIAFDLPADGTAPVVALQWAKAVQACDQKKATELQVDSDLMGLPSGPLGLCKSTSALSVSKAQKTAPGPATEEIVSQYGDSSLSWSRTVDVNGAANPLSVVLAPIGNSWRVLAVLDS